MFRTNKLILPLFLVIYLLLVNCFCFASESQATKKLSNKNFTLTDMQHVKHTLSAYKGKWVIVNYWATWCQPCLDEVPDLVALYDSRKNKDVMVLGVVFEYNNAEEVVRYVEDMLMSYPIILGDDAIKNQIGPAEVLPTTFIYDPAGILVKIKRGGISKSYIEEIMAGMHRSEFVKKVGSEKR